MPVDLPLPIFGTIISANLHMRQGEEASDRGVSGDQCRISIPGLRCYGDGTGAVLRGYQALTWLTRADAESGNYFLCAMLGSGFHEDRLLL